MSCPAASPSKRRVSAPPPAAAAAPAAASSSGRKLAKLQIKQLTKAQLLPHRLTTSRDPDPDEIRKAHMPYWRKFDDSSAKHGKKKHKGTTSAADYEPSLAAKLFLDRALEAREYVVGCCFSAKNLLAADKVASKAGGDMVDNFETFFDNRLAFWSDNDQQTKLSFETESSLKPTSAKSSHVCSIDVN